MKSISKVHLKAILSIIFVVLLFVIPPTKQYASAATFNYYTICIKDKSNTRRAIWRYIPYSTDTPSGTVHTLNWMYYISIFNDNFTFVKEYNTSYNNPPSEPNNSEVTVCIPEYAGETLAVFKSTSVPYAYTKIDSLNYVKDVNYDTFTYYKTITVPDDGIIKWWQVDQGVNVFVVGYKQMQTVNVEQTISKSYNQNSFNLNATIS